MERKRGHKGSCSRQETGPVVSPPSIDDLRVNHCALRADCVCLDRAKGREVVYRKS